MSDPSPLLVPVQVRAMVVNNPAVSFVRAQMSYASLNEYQSPSPAPFQQDEPRFAANAKNQGVYVMWTLPEALRHGVQGALGAIDFPFVPNRWLVVRTFRGGGDPPDAAPRIACWVVQSDALGSPDGSNFLDPSSTPAAIKQTRIGHKAAISPGSPWWEPGGQPPYFLKAIAEGNPAFAAYQPFNENVFSIHDDLATQGVGAGSLGYFVLGWYSEASADVLASWRAGVAGKDFPDALEELRWTASKAEAGARTSVYHGMTYAVQWDPNGSPPPSPRDGATPQIAVGNTAIDGVVAFARAAIQASPTPPEHMTAEQAADLLEAFLCDGLPLLGQPGAEAMLDQQIRSRWFGSSPAGTAWIIVDAEVDPAEPAPLPLTQEELDREASWLAELNEAQARFDATTRQLMGARRRLFELWWKRGAANQYYSEMSAYPWGISSAEQLSSAFAAQAAVVRGHIEVLAGLSGKIPTETASVTLEQAAQELGAERGLSPRRRLKAVAAPRFWQASEPVIVVSGTAHAMAIGSGAPLPCRWPEEIVTALSVNAGGPPFTVRADGAAKLSSQLPLENLPSIAASLVQEFLLLDPGGAAMLASGAGQALSPAEVAAMATSMSPPAASAGVVPAILPGFPWQQPWQPLYLDWDVQWYAIPLLRPDGAPSWVFDGGDYDLAPGLPAVPSRAVTGRCVLTPKPSFEFKARLERFVIDNASSAAAAGLPDLDAELQAVDRWDFLSQALSGFHTELALWSPTPVQNPDGTTPCFSDSDLTVADLMGDLVQTPPRSSMAAAPRRGGGPPPSAFGGIRAGQLAFNRVSVVDAFGQTLEIVTDQTSASFHPLLAEGVLPAQTVVSTEPARFVQLPPRLLQPARLNFELVPQKNGNPILGWILPNHLDRGLMVYGADGAAYGELHPGTDAQGSPFVAWSQAPGSPFGELASLQGEQPELGGFLVHLAAAGPQAFAAFLQAVDEALWTVDPLDERSDVLSSLLLGRPIAVVAASLSFELQADVYRDPSWPYTFAQPPPDPAFLKYPFSVRLGDLGYRRDGLLGYFVDGELAQLQAIHVPEDAPSTPYLREIGPGNYVELQFGARGAGPARSVMLLMDPRASVHAQCGILPVKEVALRPEWVEPPLRSMVVTFRTGPCLARREEVTPAGRSHGVAGLAVPAPPGRSGAWSWVELGGDGEWASMPLAPVDGRAVFPDEPPTLREGFLQARGEADE